MKINATKSVIEDYTLRNHPNSPLKFGGCGDNCSQENCSQENCSQKLISENCSQKVVEAFVTLLDVDILPPEAADVVNYFKNTWIDRPHCRGSRAPKFVIRLLNCDTAGTDAMPKMNKAVEEWHIGFEATLDAMHPNIYFVEVLHREQAIAEANAEFAIVGQPLP